MPLSCVKHEHMWCFCVREKFVSICVHLSLPLFSFCHHVTVRLPDHQPSSFCIVHDSATGTHTYSWYSHLVAAQLWSRWNPALIAAGPNIGCEYWHHIGCIVDMSCNISLFENNKGLLDHSGSCNITLFAILHFLCTTSASEWVYRCCVDLITFNPLHSKTSSVKPRGEKSNYILPTLSANRETGFLYLGT